MPLPDLPIHSVPHTSAQRQHNDSPALEGEVSPDFIRAERSASDLVQLANLQSPQGGREFGQAVAAAARAESGAAVAPVPLEALAVEIASRAQAGRHRFEIRLDPPELGRIEVRLDIDRSGQVTSRLIVERVETLDVLRRDAYQLERALQDAGLKTSDAGLQFALRDQATPRHDDRSGDARYAPTEPDVPAADNAAAEYRRLLIARDGIDIRV